ncbi:hypothetical protein MKW98_002964 [Papaver atlanticum]|uniref:FAD-binding PCMH-type domain-containing protein n=1 Tax=Papaver atlanticum TaxID=357466 RepID=A0AAD4THA8_9MAGN|nr:hypothetical protein MKW98_002964 [Papaver atlanticum]
MSSSSRYNSLPLVSLLISFFVLSTLHAAASSHGDFLNCITLHSNSRIPIYTPKDSSYSSILRSTAECLRFNSSTTLKPFLIVTPLKESHIPTVVICSRKNGIHIRVRSGGHDLEGLSYAADVPFIIVDLLHLRKVNVDVKNKAAWVQTGATIGEVFYKIAKKSNTLGFPAGICPTVGTGGHLSGGGYGSLVRKYGLASDNVIDARVVDVRGRILNKTSMGEDLFWAIRGGGGASFVIVVAWKIRLVPVPPTVTVFSVDKTLEDGATSILHKWQQVAHMLPPEIYIIVSIGAGDVSSSGKIRKDPMIATFISLFLGDATKHKKLMDDEFPELGLASNDFTEMSWIQSVLVLAGLPANTSTDILLNMPQKKLFFKGKSDYVRQPISQTGIEMMWKRLVDDRQTALLLTPYGGRMSEISESETPFPHRDGVLFDIFYYSSWDEEQDVDSEKFRNELRITHEFMTPYVSKNPRESYVNYRDLDLGQSSNGTASYSKAAVWGYKYFKGNFDRLVSVKTKVDPDNFFRNEQSIPR